MTDYLVHFVLEALGGGTCACAMRYCPHAWMRLALWLTLGLASSYITVQMVG